MSRLASKPILLNAGVNCVIEGSNIKVTKSNKTINFPVNSTYIETQIENNTVLFSRNKTTKTPIGLKGLLGTTWAKFKLVLKDIENGCKAKINLVGVGYRASIVKAGNSNYLKILVGFSHPIFIFIPKDITVVLEKEAVIVSGENTEKVTEFCARIRSQKKPTVYHGTGVLVNDEVIIKKAGKKK